MQLILTRPSVPAIRACGVSVMVCQVQAQHLYDSGHVAKLYRRKRDGKVSGLTLLAVPGEIARRSSQSTVVHDLPMTYSHRANPRAWRCDW